MLSSDMVVHSQRWIPNALLQPACSKLFYFFMLRQPDWEPLLPGFSLAWSAFPLTYALLSNLL